MKIDEIVQRLETKFATENQFYWYFGSPCLPTIRVDDVLISGFNCPHPYVLGSKSSGKTTTLETISNVLKAAYKEEVHIVKYNHHKSLTMTLDRKRDTLNSMMENYRDEAFRRDQLFKTYDVGNVVEFRKKIGPLKEIVLMFDDFSEVIDLMDYDLKCHVPGSSAYIMIDALTKWKRYGIHILPVFSRFSQTYSPSRIVRNLSYGIILRLSDYDYDSTKAYFPDWSVFNNYDVRSFIKGGGLLYTNDATSGLPSTLISIPEYSKRAAILTCKCSGFDLLNTGHNENCRLHPKNKEQV